MSATSASTDATAFLAEVRGAVDTALVSFLEDRRAELAALDASAVELVDEIRRLVDAGGKRIRPTLCVVGARAGGVGDDRSVVDASVALELLHTFALIHDDVMDAATTRGGIPTTQARYDDERVGHAMAILVGDLAAVLAEQRLRTCGADAAALAVAQERFDRMRI